MGADGWNAVRRSEAFIREESHGLAEQEPGGGCPGPAVVDVGESFRLLLLDTEWWLQKAAYPKPTDAASGCATFTEGAIADRLARLPAESGGGGGGAAGGRPAPHPPAGGGGATR